MVVEREATLVPQTRYFRILDAVSSPHEQDDMAPAIGLRQPASYRLGDDVDFRRPLPSSDRDWDMTHANAAVPARRRSQVKSVQYSLSETRSCTQLLFRGRVYPVLVWLSFSSCFRRLLSCPGYLLRCNRLLFFG